MTIQMAIIDSHLNANQAEFLDALNCLMRVWDPMSGIRAKRLGRNYERVNWVVVSFDATPATN